MLKCRLHTDDDPCSQRDTILSQFKEQNRQFPKTSSVQVFYMSPFRRVLSILSLLFFLGCGAQDQAPQTGAVELANRDRPPLKVWLIDAPELEKELGVRWQAASDQPIEIENLSALEIASSLPLTVDVIVYPGNQMGDLIQKGVIGRLPSQAIDKKDSESLPARWRNISHYGGHCYAVPLGAVNLGAVARGIRIQPLIELDGVISNARGLNAISEQYWNKFLEPIESKAALSNDAASALATKLSALSPHEKDWLVERFLWVAATTDARTKGLFDLVKMEARLNQPEFKLAANIFARLVRAFSNTLLDEPTAAWSSATVKAVDKIAFAIGWPKSAATETETDQATWQSSEKPIVTPLIWNANHGLVASIGKNTRQTSVSNKFLLWISEPEQREALRTLCPRIELRSGQLDRSASQDDYREFQIANNRDTRQEGMQLSLRLANADQYRALLADSLVAAILAPDKAGDIMAKCSQDWNDLTTKLGKEPQRLSEQQSLGYMK